MALQAHYDMADGAAWSIPAERQETAHSRSICLIGAGKLQEGFTAYEVRNDQRFRAYLHHMVEAPMWKGENRWRARKS